MKPEYELLYNDLKKDLNRIGKLELPETERVTACYWSTINYWEQLKKEVPNIAFANEQTEIEFFRCVKPQFTSHIEFYTILSEALVCVPDSLLQLKYYWTEEAKRPQRLIDRHGEFIQYYESGERHRDKLYFLRRDPDIVPALRPPVYDADSAFNSTHDHLVRSFLAGKLYTSYCDKKLAAL